jgi:hypothetical protein
LRRLYCPCYSLTLIKTAGITKSDGVPTGCATRCKQAVTGRGRRKRPLMKKETNYFLRKRSLPMIPKPCIEIQTSPIARPSVPQWFAEVVIIVHHLTEEGILDAFAHQVCLVRGRFGTYEPIDFLAPLLGYVAVLQK